MAKRKQDSTAVADASGDAKTIEAPSSGEQTVAVHETIKDKTVSFPIDIEALKFWNQQMKYDAEPGKFNVFIGVDSARVKQSEFELL